MGKLRDIINARSKGEKVDYKLNVEELTTPSPVQTEADEQAKKKSAVLQSHMAEQGCSAQRLCCQP